MLDNTWQSLPTPLTATPNYEGDASVPHEKEKLIKLLQKVK